jgi:hypothetical protein
MRSSRTGERRVEHLIAQHRRNIDLRLFDDLLRWKIQRNAASMYAATIPKREEGEGEGESQQRKVMAVPVVG